LFSVTLSVVAGLRRKRPRLLRGMLPCGVRTFLPRFAPRAIVHHPLLNYSGRFAFAKGSGIFPNVNGEWRHARKFPFTIE
jgi:hypothetical protein